MNGRTDRVRFLPELLIYVGIDRNISHFTFIRHASSFQEGVCGVFNQPINNIAAFGTGDPNLCQIPPPDTVRIQYSSAY